MFPVIAFIGAALVADRVVRSCAMAVLGTKAVTASTEAAKLHRNSFNDVNPEFERNLEQYLALKRQKELTEDQLRILASGVTSMTDIEVPEEVLPEPYKEFAGKYFVTARDEVLLWYFVMRKQVEARHGNIGAHIQELAERSGVSYERIERTVFGADSVDAVLEPLVRTIRTMSARRRTDERLQAFLAPVTEA